MTVKARKVGGATWPLAIASPVFVVPVATALAIAAIFVAAAPYSAGSAASAQESGTSARRFLRDSVKAFDFVAVSTDDGDGEHGASTTVALRISSVKYGTFSIPVKRAASVLESTRRPPHLQQTVDVTVHHANGTATAHTFSGFASHVEGSAAVAMLGGRPEKVHVHGHFRDHAPTSAPEEEKEDPAAVPYFHGVLRIGDAGIFHIEPSVQYHDAGSLAAQRRQQREGEPSLSSVPAASSRLADSSLPEGDEWAHVIYRRGDIHASLHPGKAADWLAGEESAYAALLKEHRKAILNNDIQPPREQHPYHAHGQLGSADATTFPPSRRGRRSTQANATASLEATACQGKCTCPVTLIIDSTYYKQHGRNRDVVTAAVVSHINEADAIFRSSTLGDVFGVGLSVARVVIYEEDGPPSPIRSGGSYSADSFLNAFSTSDWSDVCLAHIFTHREFADGLLGLAWVGQRGAGICSNSYNTGFTTTLSFGSTVSDGVAMITTAHELGHNFGSPHDEPGSACAPGGTAGNYIMYPSATDGSKNNNDQFSPCSEQAMGSVFAAHGGCFDSSRAFCGNGIVEGDEVCDCGDCSGPHPCCTTECTLPQAVECSPQDPLRYPCCQSNCTFVAATARQQCRAQEECLQSSTCSGNEATCPSPEPNEDGTLCACLDGDCEMYPQSAARVCLSGQCRGSICTRYNATSCKDVLDDCKVACIGPGWGNGSECVSTLNSNKRHKDVKTVLVYPANTPCDDYNGYCRSDGACISLRNQDILDDLEDFFKNLTAGSIFEWIKKNAKWVGIGAGIFVAVVALLLLTRSKARAVDVSDGGFEDFHKRGSRNGRSKHKAVSKRENAHTTKNKAYQGKPAHRRAKRQVLFSDEDELFRYDDDDEEKAGYKLHASRSAHGRAYGGLDDDDEDDFYSETGLHGGDEDHPLLEQRGRPRSSYATEGGDSASLQRNRLGFLHPNITEAQTKKILRSQPRGTFLMRRDPRGELILAYACGKVTEVLVKEDPSTGQYWVGRSLKKFSSLYDLVCCYARLETDPEDQLHTQLTYPIFYGKPSHSKDTNILLRP